MPIQNMDNPFTLSTKSTDRLFSLLKEKGKYIANHSADELILSLLEGEKKSVESEIEFFNISDAIGYGVYILDEELKITRANKSYLALTGMWEKEFLGKDIHTVTNEYFVNTRTVAMEALKTGRPAEGLGRPKRTDRDLLVTSIPLLNEDHQVSKVVTILMDVTKLVKLQKKLDKNLEKTEIFEHEINYYRTREKQIQLLMGKNEYVERIKNLITQVAPVDTTVLISGETGVGKEVVSREIHTRSNRCNFPYIKVNCAAIPASLMESELFGYEKGAFTGADNKRKLGLFETANNGTILLDEIGEMPIPLQTKLLRVLQEKEITRLGGTQPVPIDVRVIAATNKDLLKEIEDNNFRKDLYYRLCVIPIEIPPLRERLDDVQQLAEHFMDTFNRKYSMTKKLSPKAVEVLKNYDWPGNVRELENIIERLIVITKSNLIDEDVVSPVVCGRLSSHKEEEKQTGQVTTLKDAVQKIEKQMIEEALNDTGSSYKAAEKLGIDQSTIFRKAKKLGITEWK